MSLKALDPLLAPLKRPALAELLGEADLELDADDDLIDNLGKDVPKDTLIPFAQHGSGSLLALWRTDPRITSFIDLDRMEENLRRVVETTAARSREWAPALPFCRGFLLGQYLASNAAEGREP